MVNKDIKYIDHSPFKTTPYSPPTFSPLTFVGQSKHFLFAGKRSSARTFLLVGVYKNKICVNFFFKKNIKQFHVSKFKNDNSKALHIVSFQI